MTRSDSPSLRKPAAEVEVDPNLVATLLRAQHPDLAALPLRPAASGWDNALFRLGDELCVRLPRRALGARLLTHEQDWLPRLAGELPLPVPAPVRVGHPGEGYPWSWSIVPWFEGVTADRGPFDSAAVPTWASFLSTLHGLPVPRSSDVPAVPANVFRGVPLATRRVPVEERLQRLAKATQCITPSVGEAWEEALRSPVPAAPRWLHGDLHPRNVLSQDGRPCAVLDWGDLTVGDVATDLASVWMLFARREDRVRALALYGADQATVQRARGWAILFAAVLLDTGRPDGDSPGDPDQARTGERIFARIGQD